MFQPILQDADQCQLPREPSLTPSFLPPVLGACLQTAAMLQARFSPSVNRNYRNKVSGVSEFLLGTG